LTLDSAAAVPSAAQQEFDRAIALAQSGDLAAAERAFDTLNAQYPDYAGPLVNLAILRGKAGNLEAAEQALQSAIERNPNSAQAFNHLGILYRRLGRFKDADTAYQRAVELDPNYANAHLNLGVLCDLYLQQPQRALQAFERYLELAGQPDAKVSGWVSELKARVARGAGSASSARSEQ
jgi:tetratricopeptide (TPR) repeat protein